MTITEIIDYHANLRHCRGNDSASVDIRIPFCLPENYYQSMFIFYI